MIRLIPVQLFFAALLLTLSGFLPAVAATQVASPGACVDDAGIGSQAWGGLGNVGASDNNYATANATNSQITHYLKCTGYNFSIPAGSVITGITVGAEFYSPQTFYDYAVRLVKGGAVQATNYATNSRLPNPDPNSLTSYGGAADLWGNTWAVADINNTGFGVAFAAQRGPYNSTRTVYVDYLQITVNYTVSAAPSVTTDAASSITPAGATLNGTVSSNGASTTVTFNYGLTTAYGGTVSAAQSPLAAGATAAAVSAAISGLTCNTLYHYRAKGVNSYGTTNGADQTFTTASCPPSATTNAATSVTGTGATVNGTVSSNGSSTDVSFEYGTDTSYGSTATALQSPLASGASNAAVSASLTGLDCMTTYHFRVVATNASGTSYGGDQTFTTSSSCPAPAATAVGSPSICTNIASIGTQAWSNTGGAFTSDNTYATSSVNDNQTSNYIQCTGYGFNIPPGSTINGITVSVERKARSSRSIVDAAMRLVKNNVIQATDRSTATQYPTADAYENHGGATDVWGGGWTAADINSPNFGAAFASIKPGTRGGNRTVSVDHMQITIDYTPPSWPVVMSINTNTIYPINSGSTATWTVTFSMPVTGVDATDFALVQSGGVSGASITSVTGSGDTWTVSANTGSGAGSLGLNLIDNDSIINGSGARLGGTGTSGTANGSFTGQVYTIVVPPCDTNDPNLLFCDDFERSVQPGGSNTAGSVGAAPNYGAWTVGPLSGNCAGIAGNAGCAGIDSDLPPWDNYSSPRANPTRSMFTRWSTVTVDSPVIDLSGQQAAQLSFWLRRGSDCFSEWPGNIATGCGGNYGTYTPTYGEEYQVQYKNNTGAWAPLIQFPEVDTPGEIFTPTVDLPDDAFWSGFQLRFYQPGGSGSNSTNGGAPGVRGYDYWHMDNVKLVAKPAVPYAGGFCDTFEGDLSRWNISGVGNARIGSTYFNGGSHDMDIRWGQETVASKSTDMSSATGNIVYWVKRGTGNLTQAPNTTGSDYPEAGKDLVVEYLNNVGNWINLDTFAGGGTAGQVYNANHPFPLDGKFNGFKLRFRLLTGTGFDFDYWHVDDVCVGDIINPADLSLTMSSGGTFKPGKYVTYTMTATNNGPTYPDPGPITITDTLTAGLTYTSGSAGWSCSNTGQVVTCTQTGGLAVGASTTLTITASVDANAPAGPVTNSAYVGGQTQDTNTANNTATHTDNIQLLNEYAWYMMDEISWTGAAGEVLDSSGNTRNATLSPSSGLSTAYTPAYGLKGDTCRGGAIVADTSTATLKGINTGIDVNSLGNTGTISFWYYNNAAWNASGNASDRTLFDATNGAGGQFWLVLQQGGALNFSLSNNAGVTQTATATAQTFAANTWHFIAVTWDFIGQHMTLYVDGAQAGSYSNAAITSTTSYGNLLLGDNKGTAYAPNRGNSANGTLDEVRLYDAALSTAQIQADMNASHSCPVFVDHYEVSLPAENISCLPATVTVTACANNTSPCTQPYSGLNNQTATLSASAGTLGTATLTFNNTGIASTTLNYPSAADNASVAISLSNEQVPGGSPRQCCPNGTSCSVSNSCPTTFRTAGFIFSDQVNGTTATIPTQVAGVDSSTYYLRAVKTNSSTKACQTALQGPQSVNFGYECNNPTTCTASNMMNVEGSTIQRNDNGATISYAPANLTFDANGNAPFTFIYEDAGQITLHARKTVSNGATLTGATNAFVVKPAGFVVSGIARNSDNFANPAAANASGTVFARAGEPFNVTVTAINDAGIATPNYGREIQPEGVKLTSQLVAPATGVNPAVTGTLGAFSNGVATADGASLLPDGVTASTPYAWSEVGIIKLLPSVGDGDFLGAGDVTGDNTGAASGNVGRFIPDHFDTAVIPTANIPMPCPTGLTCPVTYNGFVYAGQPFTLQVSANNLAGSATANYDDILGFAKNVTLNAWDALGGSMQNPGGGSLNNNALAATAFRIGTTSAPGTHATPNYTFNTAPTVPTDIYLRAQDTDGVTSLRPVAANSIEGGVKVVSGRYLISNAYGSELLPLAMTATVQYFDAAGDWATSTTDDVTAFNTGTDLGSGSFKGLLTAADIVANPAGPVTVISGVGNFVLNQPNKTGSADITINAPPYLPSVAGRATFGVYRDNANFIYQREQF